MTHNAKLQAEKQHKNSLLPEDHHNSHVAFSSKIDNESSQLNLHMFDSTVLVQSIAAVWGQTNPIAGHEKQVRQDSLIKEDSSEEDF